MNRHERRKAAKLCGKKDAFFDTAAMLAATDNWHMLDEDTRALLAGALKALAGDDVDIDADQFDGDEDRATYEAFRELIEAGLINVYINMDNETFVDCAVEVMEWNGVVVGRSNVMRYHVAANTLLA